MERTSITVSIMGRSYDLQVDTSDVEIVKDAALQLNNEAQVFAKKFYRKDQQDVLAMVAIKQALSLTQLQQQVKNLQNQIQEKADSTQNVLEGRDRNLENHLKGIVSTLSAATKDSDCDI